jgi:hypothetical protein
MENLLPAAGPGDHFVLVNGIGLSSQPWQPIAFAGNLHGGGGKITGISFSGTSSRYGLFSTLSGKVYDLKLEYAQTAEIAVSGSGPVAAGVLAGEAVYGAEISGVSVTSASDTVQFAVRATSSFSGGTLYHGGIVGLNNGALTRSFSSLKTALADGSSNVTKAQGGLAGKIGPTGTITDSYATGDVSATGSINAQGALYAGGLAGSSAGTICRSYAAGDISANNASAASIKAGGLVGCGEGSSYTINKSAANNSTVNAGSSGSAGAILGSDPTVSGSGNKWRGSSMTLTGGSTYTAQGDAAELPKQNAWPFLMDGNPWVWYTAGPYPRLHWQTDSDLFDEINKIDWGDLFGGAFGSGS